MAKIAIDPGHGINTPGKRTPKAVSRYGRVVKEYEANKLYAQEAEKELKRLGHTIIWTGGDNDPSLAARCNEANAKGADLFISFHWNAGGGTGTETYHYPGSSKGKKLAQKIHPHVVKAMGFRDRGIKTANFYVLKHTKMPAILIEFGFMDAPSNYNDQHYMLDKEKAKKAAQEIAKGVQAYLGLSYKAPSGGSSGSGGSKNSGSSKSSGGGSKYVADDTLPLKLYSKDGSKNLVSKVQKALGIKADGYYGPDTVAAVKAFQKKKGLVVDGIVGENTWAALFPKVTLPSGIIRRGDKGEKVKQLQNALLKAGEKLPKYGADGHFGAETEAAVKSFQRKKKLAVDGIYGPKTKAALEKALS